MDKNSDKYIRDVDAEIADIIVEEYRRQNRQIELIASENFTSRAVMAAMGSVLTNKYAEGYPAKRYYGGCEVVDKAENLARDRAKQIFGCDHVNVQPHAGSQANMAVYFSQLQPGDTILAMNLTDGGHLTHGSPSTSPANSTISSPTASAAKPRPSTSTRYANLPASTIPR